MAAVGMEEVGMEVEMAGEMKEVVTAAARMEDEEAVQVVAVTKVEETGKAAEVMVAELTEAAADGGGGDGDGGGGDGDGGGGGGDGNGGGGRCACGGRCCGMWMVRMVIWQ